MCLGWRESVERTSFQLEVLLYRSGSVDHVSSADGECIQWNCSGLADVAWKGSTSNQQYLYHRTSLAECHVDRRARESSGWRGMGCKPPLQTSTLSPEKIRIFLICDKKKLSYRRERALM